MKQQFSRGRGEAKEYRPCNEYGQLKNWNSESRSQLQGIRTEFTA